MKKSCLLNNKLIKTITSIFLFQIMSCSSIDGEVSKLVSSMTVEEKIGQMTQVDYRYLADKADIGKYFLGSILSGGGSTLQTLAGYLTTTLKNGIKISLSPIL